MLKQFERFLLQLDLSENTIKSYLFTISDFFKKHSEISERTLLSYKGYLIEHYKPKTVNLRLQGINKYLEYIHKDNLKMKFIKIQQKSFLENVISDADYTFFKNRLLEDNNLKWYFVIRFLGATGARVSELVQIKVEHVKLGHIDLYTKGGKMRRIFIPKELQKDALLWLESIHKSSGYLFCGSNKNIPITTRAVDHQLKILGEKYGMNTKVIYPHSFRHRFAKNFLEKYNDIALLADLMGHESIETTRIYLKRTSEEQKEIVDEVVTW